MTASWHDWLICEILLEEAKAKIKTQMAKP